ncbi:MAG: hypothetical protein KF889_18820 [Alphaproteobacteria bacterium]|nr:hypothetical protein [Alphaproteobacteria bacterium]MCW5743877.1 hypothetical protein [Alphaproteobacteria bacterium]
MARWGALAFALALVAIAVSASAETKTLARSGSWEAFGGTATDGTGVCGISAEPGGRYFGLKLFGGQTTFDIQMGTSQWKIEKGAKVPLTMRFDGHPIWRATATGFHFDDGDAGLQFAVHRNQMENFAREFRDSSQLRIDFKDNQFPAWILGLQGTATVNGAFQSCLRKLG